MYINSPLRMAALQSQGATKVKTRFIDLLTLIFVVVWANCASAQTYSQTFDSISPGNDVSTISGWANEVGTTLYAANNLFYSSPNSVVVGTDGDSAVYIGGGSYTNTTVQLAIRFTNSTGHARLHVRSDGSQNWYEAIVSPASPALIEIRKHASGADQADFTTTGTSATNVTTGAWYYLSFSVTGSSAASLGVSVWPVAGTQPSSSEVTASDSTSPFTSGYPGIRLDYDSGTNTHSYADNFSFTGTSTSGALTSGNASTTFVGNTTASVAVTAGTGGTSPYTYQWYRSATSGFTPGSGNSVSGATGLTLNDTGLTNGTTYYYVDKVTDNASSTANSNQTSATPSSSCGLTAGTPSITSVGSTIATVTSTASTHGCATITYQWYRSVVPTSSGTAVSGATSLTLSDTGLTNGTPYYYVLQATDGTTTISYAQLAVIPQKVVYIGLIGDSYLTTYCPVGGSTVTGGAAPASGFILQQKLQALYRDGTRVIVNNQGVGGTNGNDWAPNGGSMNTAVSAFNSANSIHSAWTIMVHLGINDSSVNNSSPTGGESAAQYQAYMQAIANYFIQTWGALNVIFIGPPYIGSISANHTTNGVSLLSSYQGALTSVAATNSGHVFAPFSEFNNFIANPGDTGTCDNVHPFGPDANGQGGTTNLSTMWARSIYGVVNPTPLWTHY
jgi:hypothetical protein